MWHGFTAGFGSVFGLVPLAYTYLTNMPRQQALRNLLIVVAIFSMVNIGLKQVVWVKRRYDFEVQQTATAILKDAECSTLSDLLLSDPDVGQVCTNARITRETSPLERSVTSFIESWPDPRKLFTSLPESLEMRLAAILLVAWFLSALVDRPARYIGRRYTTAGHDAVMKQE